MSKALRQHATRRVTFALARFDDRVTGVSLRFTDDNGPRGGVDKRCVLRVRLAGMPDVVLTERTEDLYGAIDRAADRAGRTVARRLRRQHDMVCGAGVPTADRSD